jgi:hypothetical protein
MNRREAAQAAILETICLGYTFTRPLEDLVGLIVYREYPKLNWGEERVAMNAAIRLTKDTETYVRP